jgi:nucleotide-binding universal stress UspA family protein
MWSPWQSSLMLKFTFCTFYGASIGSWTPMFPIPPKPDFKRIASDFESQVLAQAKQKLDAFIKRHFKDIRIGRADVVSGTNYKQIIQYVESEKIDLIIMGTGTTLQKVMFGAVAEKVSRLSTVPVMLIKSSSNK